MTLLARTKNIAAGGPDPPDADTPVTARTPLRRDYHKVIRVWNYHQVKAWYQTLHQRLCAKKDAQQQAQQQKVITRPPTSSSYNTMEQSPMSMKGVSEGVAEAATTTTTTTTTMTTNPQSPQLKYFIEEQKRPYPSSAAPSRVMKSQKKSSSIRGLKKSYLESLSSSYGKGSQPQPAQPTATNPLVMRSNFSTPNVCAQIMQLQAQNQILQQQMFAQQHATALLQQQQQATQVALQQRHQLESQMMINSWS